MIDIRDAFRSAAREKGLPVEAIESRIKLARPQLALLRDGDGPVVGQIGGRPSLPEGEDWPGGLAHVATIDLARLTRDHHDLDLPHDGHLVFLAEVGDYAVRRQAKVVYVPAGTPVRERDLPEDSMYRDEVIDPMPLHGTLRWTLAPSRSDTPFPLSDRDEDEEDVEEAIDDVVVYLDDHIVPPFAIGGYDGTIMSSDGDVITDASKMTLLASAYLASDTTTEPLPRLPTGAAEFWQADILLEFVIAYADLADRRFENIEVHVAWKG